MLVENKMQDPHIKFDNNQQAALDLLMDFINQVNNFYQGFKLLRLFKTLIYQTIYLYGSVGAGKTMIMDIGYNKLKTERKYRVHFHQFMQDIHKLLHQLRSSNTKDIIGEAAKILKEKYDIICFDELHLTEVTDVMLLTQLFAALKKLNMLMIFTSNREPSKLYEKEFGRDHFKKFSEIFAQNMCVIHLEALHDYRRVKIESAANTYIVAQEEKGHDIIKDIAIRLASNLSMPDGVQKNASIDIPEFKPWHMKVNERDVVIGKYHKNILFVSYAEVCVHENWTAEYISIVRKFSYVLIWGIPQFNDSRKNEARRFIAFVDEIYEYKRILICHATVDINALYDQNNRGIFEFTRTISRLIEMQSVDWLEQGQGTSALA